MQRNCQIKSKTVIKIKEIISMSNFITTTFKFTTDEATALNITYVETYGADGQWRIMPEGLKPQGLENQGIGWLNTAQSIISTGTNGVVTLKIDPEIVNNVPYASDKASLLIGVNGSNLHIDIHGGGGMKTTGTYGNKSVEFDCDFNDVGGLTIIKCTSV
jgi:hypothetical protein